MLRPAVHPSQQVLWRPLQNFEEPVTICTRSMSSVPHMRPSVLQQPKAAFYDDLTIDGASACCIQSTEHRVQRPISPYRPCRSPKHDLLNLLLESLKQQDGKAVNGSGNGSKHTGASQEVPSPEARTKHREMNGNGHPALVNGHLELSNGLTKGHSAHENGHAGLANGVAGRGLSSKPCRPSLQVWTKGSLMYLVDLFH